MLMLLGGFMMSILRMILVTSTIIGAILVTILFALHLYADTHDLPGVFYKTEQGLLLVLLIMLIICIVLSYI